jgi:hypothetical protein
MGQSNLSRRRRPWRAIAACVAVGIGLIVAGAVFAVELIVLGVCVLLGSPLILLLLSGFLWNPRPPLDFYDWFYDRGHRQGGKSRDVRQ